MKKRIKNSDETSSPDGKRIPRKLKKAASKTTKNSNLKEDLVARKPPIPPAPGPGDMA